MGYIDFKGKLKDELNKGNISHEDALLIVLDIIYSIAEGNLTDYETVPFFFKKRMRNVKGFNREFDKNQIDSKIDKFFNHDYDFEKNIIKTHVSKLESQYRVDRDVRSYNKKIISNVKYIELDIKEKPAEKKAPKIKQKRIIKKTNFRIRLDNLNKEDLCSILGLNLELTFEKTKVLRARVINELSKLEIGDDVLKNASPNDLKRFLAPARERERKKEMEKKKLKNLISKVKSFNDKSYSDILSSKDEYLEIYNEINENFPDLNNRDFNNFKSYQNYVNHAEEYQLISERVLSQKKFIDKLNNQILDIYLNYEQRNKLKSSYKEIYELYSQINILPELLKYKFLEENNDLKEIIGLFTDLDNYMTISESGEENKIRIHNEQVLDNIIDQNKEFFKDITDINKKRAIVLDEKNVKVIAGAGTGKTFTIQKKVKYLIEKVGVDSDKILCLCYTHKGASELRKKVNNDINADVNAVTFHEFCRRVDRSCGGKRRTNKYLLDYIIRKYIHDLPLEDKINKMVEYFAYYSDEKFKRNFKNISERIKYIAEGYQTLRGKVCSLGKPVYSRAELLIANYLFIHEIDYEHEKHYESNFVDLLGRFTYSGNFLSLGDIGGESKFILINRLIDKEISWKSYYSDFYLPDYDLYLDCDDFNEKGYEQLISKRAYHKLHDTRYVNIYDDNCNDGNLLNQLNKLLIRNNVEIGLINQKEILEYFLAVDKFNNYKYFKKLVKFFINIFESKDMDNTDFNLFNEKSELEEDIFTRKRQKLLLDIISDIYNIYCEYKKSDTFDHNHEISNALCLIESGKYTPDFDYILIDEYQDINKVRCKLLQEIQEKTNCKIFVVGDDWQSIYRFNGSDVNLFINFEDYFPNSETVKLEENRRNTQKLIDISSSFILKNENQEFKTLNSFKNEVVPNLNPIKIVYYDNDNKYERKDNKILKLDAIISDILKNNRKKGLKILILGRNNKDIDYLINNGLFREKIVGKYRKILYSKHKDLDMTFMTIHQAKGLEYDEVIVINFENNEYWGFPNDTEDDPLLKFVKEYESYPYAEERRLLYVALTRTLNNVYLLAPKMAPSTFIYELRSDFGVSELCLPIDEDMEYDLYEDSDFFTGWEYYETDIPCPRCRGKLTIVVDNYRNTKYVRCSNHAVSKPYHYNGGPIPRNYSKDDVKYIEKCPSCNGVLIRYGDVLKCCLNSKGCTETKELKLDEAELEYDE